MAINLGVNYLAVVVAAVATMVLGFIWYAPQVFGKQWAAAAGVQLPGGMTGPAIAFQVIAALLNAWVLALFSLNLGGKAIADGIGLGVLAWLGFIATATVGAVAFEKKSWSYWSINNGFQLVNQVVMASIVTVWR